jgi:hypothetical protein
MRFGPRCPTLQNVEAAHDAIAIQPNEHHPSLLEPLRPPVHVPELDAEKPRSDDFSVIAHRIRGAG